MTLKQKLKKINWSYIEILTKPNIVYITQQRSNALAINIYKGMLTYWENQTKNVFLKKHSLVRDSRRRLKWTLMGDYSRLKITATQLSTMQSTRLSDDIWDKPNLFLSSFYPECANHLDLFGLPFHRRYQISPVEFDLEMKGKGINNNRGDISYEVFLIAPICITESEMGAG